MKIIINKNLNTEKTYSVNNIRIQYYPETDTDCLACSMPYEKVVMEELKDFIRKIKIVSITVLNNSDKIIYETTEYTNVTDLNYTIIDGFSSDIIFLTIGKEES